MTIIDLNFARRQDELNKSGVDRDDIRARLHADVKGFVIWLYGGRAYFTKTDARIGDVEGNAGSSLSIDLREGLWKDHATDEHGDLISLYRGWRGHTGDDTFVLSLKEIARDYLGDSIEIEYGTWGAETPRERMERQKAKLGSKPRQENVELGAPVAEWKYEDLQGDIIASVKRYEPDGTPESKQYRPYCFKKVDGEKRWVMGAPVERPLYKLHELATSPVVILVEGEKCAEALRSIGIVATTAMQGAKAPIEKTDWSILAGKKVIVWPDKDPPGFDYGRRVAQKLQSIGCEVWGVTPPEDKPEKWDCADCVAEGGDTHGILEGAAPFTAGDAPGPRPRVEFLDVDDLANFKIPVYLIEGVLPEGVLSELWGPPSALKTFVALDIALCIATGRDWHGRAVKQGLVFYLAAEGAYGMGARVTGWRAGRGVGFPRPAFKLIPNCLELTNQDDIDALVAGIMAFGERPALIVLDTLARTFGPGDENKQADMNLYVRAADRLKALGAHVMIIHHSGVNGERPRGSNVLEGAIDTMIRVKRLPGKHPIKVDLINRKDGGGKMKDGPEFQDIHLEATEVAAQMLDGETMTLVMSVRDPEKDPEPGKSGPKGGRPSPNQDKVMEAIKASGKQMTIGEIVEATKLKKESVKTALKALVERNLVSKSRNETIKGYLYEGVASVD